MSSTLTPHSSVDVLAELFHSATNHASKAMAQWTHGHVELSLEEIQEHSLEEISCCIDMGAELMRMVVLGIQGDLDGQLILAFDAAHGAQTAAVGPLSHAGFWCQRSGACADGSGDGE